MIFCKKQVLSSFFLAILFLFGFYNFCQAQLADYGAMVDQEEALADAAGFDTEGDPEIQLTVLISTVIKAFLSFLGIIFLVLMLYAGYNWMTAAGDEGKVETAKSTIQRAVIGLVIVVSAYAITYSVFSVLE